jgi:hypothetical protein
MRHLGIDFAARLGEANGNGKLSKPMPVPSENKKYVSGSSTAVGAASRQVVRLEQQGRKATPCRSSLNTRLTRMNVEKWLPNPAIQITNVH